MGQIWKGYPLAEAIAKQDIVKVREIIKNDRTAIEHCWLESGSPYQPASIMLETALSLAVKTGNAEIVGELLDSGAALIGLQGWELSGKIDGNYSIKTVVTCSDNSKREIHVRVSPNTYIFTYLSGEKMAGVIFNCALARIKAGQLNADDDLGDGTIADWAGRLNNKEIISELKIKVETNDYKPKYDTITLTAKNKEAIDDFFANGKRNVLYSHEARKWSKEAEDLGLYDYYDNFLEGEPEMKRFFIPSDRPKKEDR